MSWLESGTCHLSRILFLQNFLTSYCSERRTPTSKDSERIERWPSPQDRLVYSWLLVWRPLSHLSPPTRNHKPYLNLAVTRRSGSSAASGLSLYALAGRLSERCLGQQAEIDWNAGGGDAG